MKPKMRHRERDRRAAELFEELVELPEEEEKVRRLALIYAEDPELARKVASLLERDMETDLQDVAPFLSFAGADELRPKIHPSSAISGIDIGVTLDSKYQIEEKIGEGGMGVVYAARHQKLGTRVAIKVLQPSLGGNEKMSRRFLGEAMAAGQISHAGIVEVFDVGRHVNGQLFIVMEYLEGETLARRRRRITRFPVRRAIALVCQALNALVRVHEAGIIHRDLKPENMFLVEDPEISFGERIKLLDFGLAKLRHDPRGPLTQQGVVLGTPRYMAPEQFGGVEGIDHRGDLYAMGVILYELLSGELPFECRTIMEYVRAHSSQEPRPITEVVPSLAPEIGHLVMRLLHKEPAQRFQSASELREALQAVRLLDDDATTDVESRGQRAGSHSFAPTVPLVPVEHEPQDDEGGVPETVSLKRPGSEPAPGSNPESEGEGSDAFDPEPDSAAPQDANLPSRARHWLVRGVVIAVLASLLLALAFGLASWLRRVMREDRCSASVECLLARLDDEYQTGAPYTRTVFLQDIPRIGEPMLIPLLDEAIDNGTPTERDAAIISLCAIEDRSSLAKLRAAHERVSAGTRHDIDICLLQIGDDVEPASTEGLPGRWATWPLARKLDALSGLVERGFLAMLLEPAAEAQPEGPARGSGDWLVERCATTYTNAVEDRDQAVRALADCPGCEPRIRIEAARCLAQNKALGAATTASALDQLVRTASDANAHDRWQALEILARLGHSTGLEHVIASGLEHTQPEIRRVAVVAAARAARGGDRRFASELRWLAENDPEPTVRNAALMALITVARNS